MINKDQHQNKILNRYLQKSSERLSTDETLSGETKERIRSINAFMVQIFLDSKDIETHNLLPYIRHLVKRFKLGGICEFDILIETYTIAIKNTKKGYVIKNRPAWFKSTASHIISNLSREMKKQDLVKSALKYDQSDNLSLESSNISSDKIQFLVKAFKNLREEDRHLLNLRVVEGLTWSDIAEKMIADGKEYHVSEELLARLRKRHQRALDRLRKSYKQQVSE